jgi:hypothetical protein
MNALDRRQRIVLALASILLSLLLVISYPNPFSVLILIIVGALSLFVLHDTTG